MDAFFSLIFDLPGQGALLRLDPLSLFFVAILLLQGGASALAGLRASVGFWLCLVGMVLILVSGAAFALIFGVGLMTVAAWYMAARGDPKPAALYAGIVVFALACLIPALALPPSSLAFGLVTLGVGALAGLAPFYNWLPRLCAVLPEAMSGLLSGGAVNVALYILIRYVFVTASGAQQPWWGVVLVVLGAVSVVIGALRAALEVDLREGLVWSAIASVGVSAIGIGVALQAKALGHTALAGLALQAVLLWILAHGLFRPLLLIGAGEVRHTVGTASLNWLGGLMRGMPRLGLCMLLGAAGMALLPLGPAFAPVLLLVHAVIGTALQGGVIAHLGGAVLLAVLGLGAGLMVLAAVKMIGLGFLGRPRSLHAAAAEDIRRGPFLGMVLLGVFCIPVALVPGLILALCTPIIHRLAPLARTESLAYTPLVLWLLVGVALLVAGFAQMHWGVRGLRESSAFNGGFGRPPTWLPFGDPHTQSSASGFAEPLLRVCGRLANFDPASRFLWPPLSRLYGWAVAGARRTMCLTPRLWLAIMFAALMLALLIFDLARGG